MTAAIGRPPSWPDFTADDLSAFIDQMRQAQADAGGLNPTAPGLVRGAGEVDPTGRGTGSIDQRRPPQFAGNEADVQRLERQMASPQDLAALGPLAGSPNALLFDRQGMGSGASGFTGRADPYGARQVPLPPTRPGIADLVVPQPDPATTGTVQGTNPGVGPLGVPPIAGRPSPGVKKESDIFRPVDSFDPLTGAVTSGQPQQLGRSVSVPPGGVSPFGGQPAAMPAPTGYGAPQSAPQVNGAGAPGALQQSMIEKFVAGVNNPDFSDLMFNIGMGLLSGNRGIGPGIATGMQSYQEGRAGNLRQQLQMIQLQQQAQQQAAARNYVKSRGGSPELQALAEASPSSVLTGGLTGLNAQPTVQEIDGKKYWLKAGDTPSAANLIGDVTGKDRVHFDRDPVTGELTAYRLDQIFPGGGAEAGGGAAAGSGAASGGGAGADASADAGSPMFRVLSPGNRGVRIFGQPDPRTGQIVQPPPNSPPGVSGYYDATGKPVTLATSPETERDKAVGGAIGKDIAGYIEAGKPAREKMAALNILSDAWKAGGDKITTGPSADRVLSLKQFARGSLGLDIGDNIAPSELVAKIGTQLATADAKSLTARPTQFDFATYLRNNPGLALSPEGNKALIDIKRQQAQHEIDLAALARDRRNWDNWDEVTASYDRAHPIVSPLTKRPLGADEVNFPGTGSGAGQATPPSGGPAFRFQQLRRSGMSAQDAYARMHQEGY